MPNKKKSLVGWISQYWDLYRFKGDNIITENRILHPDIYWKKRTKNYPQVKVRITIEQVGRSQNENL